MTIVLQTIIALVAIFIIFSIANSLLIEGFVRYKDRRSEELDKAIRNLFGNPNQQEGSNHPKGGEVKGLAQDFLNHSFIKKLKEAEGKNRLTWIPSDVFAETFIDLLVKDSDPNNPNPTDIEEVIENFEKGIKKLPGDLQPAVTQLIRYVKEQTGQQMQTLKNKVAGWFDAYMDRITEQYKRKTRWWLFVGGLALAICLNLDVIYLSDALFKQDDLRLNYYEYGKEISQGEMKINSDKIIEYIGDNLEQLNGNDLMNVVAQNLTLGDSVQVATSPMPLPIGWGNMKSKFYVPFGSQILSWIAKVFGIGLMALALSFGAPFWFDFMKKIVKVDRIVS